MDTAEHPLHFHQSPPPGLTRRRAMGWMAASAALASAGCSPTPPERIHPWVQMPEARGASDALYYASATLREGHAQGVLVGTREGRPIKVEGNPAHPSSLGATDPFGQASVLQLWDPDRSQAVFQRLAAPGRPAHSLAAAASSWNDFEAAWRPLAARLQASGGEGLRLLTGPITSPTQRAQIARWLQALPRARWHQHAPLADAAAHAGSMDAFGLATQAVAHFDRAACVVALGCDPFSEGPGCVRHAADWARVRAQGKAPRLLAAEVAPGLFGARADRRIALAPAQIDAMVQRVAAQLLGASGAPSAPADAGQAAFEAELLAALRAAGAGALLLPGPGLSPTTHALLHAVHQRVGASGRTLELIAPLALAPEAGTLAQLADAMQAGAVSSLVVLDANPVYDGPGALAFARALQQVPFSVHAGLERDETARACSWHLPLSHACEQWGDARAHDGSVTLLQPAIAPIYATRSPVEVLALLAGETERDGWRLVQAHWRAQWGARFDAAWRESLQRGVVPDSAPAPLQLPRAAYRPAPLAPAPGDGQLAAVFASDPSVLDGRYANNAWLQELPRPFTKHTWDNAAYLGPKTAAAAGLATGSRVRITSDAGSVEAPVWVQPLHAEGVVTLPLGYGRRAAGRVGNAVGFDAYRLRPVADAGAAVRLERIGGRHEFALTQNSQDPSGREPARSVQSAASAPHRHEELPSLYAESHSPEHAWAMVIDLDACIGCNACTIACQAENNIPVVGKEEVSRGHEMHWIRVDRYESDATGTGSIFQPVPCMHCEKAPCELVCPVGATMHDSEGLNVQVYNRCIGTRFCSNNCPYKVRRFNFLQYTDKEHESLKGQRNPEVTVRDRGVMEKCNYCLQRVARARQHSQATGVPLADGDVVTACQAVCPTSAIHFGDLHDERSAVVQLRKLPRHYALLEELGTRPRTTYLARVD